MIDLECDAVTLVRDGVEIPVKMYVQGSNRAFAPYSINAREGDILRFENLDEEQVISRVNKLKAPGGGKPNHTEISLVSKREWAKMNKPQASASVTHNWNIGTAGAITTAGDVTGPVTVNVEIGHKFFTELQKHIEADAAISEPEKRTLLDKIKDLATSPKVAEYATAFFKGWISG
jgi:hypothetical protein